MDYPQRFGRLTAISEAAPHVTSGGRKIKMVNCVCDCGSHTIVALNKLKAGATQSCGCLAKEKARQTIKTAAAESLRKKTDRRNDLVGERFGAWTIVRVFVRGGISYANVVCDCGEESEVTINSLVRGTSKGCGRCGNKKSHDTFKKRECVEGTAMCRLTQKVRSDSATGVKGVYINKRNGKFVAELKLSGVKHWLGEFYTLEEAKKARAKAEEQYFDPLLARYGRPKTMEDIREP